MQVLRDPRPLRQPFLEPDVEPPRDLVHPEAVHAGRSKHDRHRAGELKPGRLPDPWSNSEADGGFSAAPLIVAVGRHDPEAVRAGTEIGVDRRARRDGLAPVPVKAIEPIAEPHPLRHGQTQAGIRKGQPLATRRDVNRAAQIDRRPVGRHRLDVHDRRRRSARRVRGVGHRQTPAEREPHPAAGIDDDGPVTPDAVDAVQSVRQAIRTNIGTAELAAQEFVARDTHHAIGGRDPERTARVGSHARDGFPENRQPILRRVHSPTAHDCQTVRRSDPHDAGGVDGEAGDVARRQSVLRLIALPSTVRVGTDAIRRAQPHRPVRAFGDRRNRVGREAVGGRESREPAAAEPADAAAQRPGPHRPVATLVHRVDAVLGQPFGLRVTVAVHPPFASRRCVSPPRCRPIHTSPCRPAIE